mgnify:CR=1 FL=1
MRTSENNHQSYYYTNKKIKSQIDKLLEKNASLQASLGIDSTDLERRRVEKETKALVNKMKGLDEEFTTKTFYEMVKRKI